MSDMLHRDIERLNEKISDMAVKVENIRSSMVTRDEMQRSDGSRVSLEVFSSTTSAIIDRIIKIENGPQKILAWISLFLSGSIGCVTILLTIIGMAISITYNLIVHH